VVKVTNEDIVGLSVFETHYRLLDWRQFADNGN